MVYFSCASNIMLVIICTDMCTQKHTLCGTYFCCIWSCFWCAFYHTCLRVIVLLSYLNTSISVIYLYFGCISCAECVYFTLCWVVLLCKYRYSLLILFALFSASVRLLFWCLFLLVIIVLDFKICIHCAALAWLS